ncbi:MAG: glucose 1-dehydrogenase [Pseudomonadota bacterium]
MTGRLEGKVALVVGAGSVGPGWGNGKAAATLFAREGAKVVCADLKAEAAEETAEIIRGEGGNALAVTCNAAEQADVEALVAKAVAHYGRIDVLENNVGILHLGGPVEVDLADWNRMLQINLTSMFLTCKATLPVMLRQFEETGKGGSIVNIASIAGIRDTGVPYVAYNTTKGAVLPFTRSVALQYARKGIRANCVLPGLMNTPMIVEPLKGVYGADRAAMVEKRNQQCPMGAMGDAWDVAEAALFLASDAAKYITAAELVVDGGLTAQYGAIS